MSVTNESSDTSVPQQLIKETTTRLVKTNQSSSGKGTKKRESERKKSSKSGDTKGTQFEFSDTYIDESSLEYEYEPGISLSALHFSHERIDVLEGHCKGCRCSSSTPTGHCGGCVCHQESDLQLAAELGKTLLERNRELENSIKHHQAVIDDQGQEIEYLTKQTSALREVNESRVRVYEQLEISLQEAENLNVRLQEEAASDKARIKSLVGIVENLEQKCEDLQALTQENRNQDELSSFFRAESREKSGAAAPTKPRKHSFIQHPRSPERRLNPDHPTDLRPSHCPSSSLGCGSSSSTNEGLSNLELEILELNSELERMRDLRDQEAKRMLDLQLQVGGLVGENISLSRSLEEANTQSTADHNTDSGSGPTCLCAEVRKATCANQMKRDPIHNPANTDLKLKNIPVERQICEARRPSPGLEHQPNLVQDVKEVHRPSHVKDVKDVKDVKVAKVVKDVKDIKDVEDVKDVKDFEDVMVEDAEYVPQPNHVESFMDEHQVKPNKVQEPLASEGEKLPSYEKNFRVKTANGKQLPQANEQLRDEEQLYDEEQIPAKEQLPQANEQLRDEEQLPAKEQLEDSTAVAFNDVKMARTTHCTSFPRLSVCGSPGWLDNLLFSVSLVTCSVSVLTWVLGILRTILYYGSSFFSQNQDF